MKRVLGWVCGVVLALVTALWCGMATADLALSAGVYGTPGTYKVERCYDTDSSGRNSRYDCHGDFTPDGGTADDAEYVPLGDTGRDYPDGTEFDARQGNDPDTIQRVGFWGVVGELWQVAVCVTVLAILGYQAIKPRGRDARREAHRREPSPRQKAADRVGYAVLVAVPVGILSWIAMIAEPTS
ncbi:hypothetical protein ACIBAG_05150 [Streptomyces sp. NPDC051243]|uniref:hypothetical protein n=1 Tax=Streptomyces sp. NPDC051243 TaxID=3365646 RepID=UPI00378C2B2C